MASPHCSGFNVLTIVMFDSSLHAFEHIITCACSYLYAGIMEAAHTDLGSYTAVS